MGFTPLEGLMMGTRCGDIDASIPLFLMEENNMTAKEMTTYLNKQCGLKGITGGPSDMRAVEKGWQEGDEKLALAFEIFQTAILIHDDIIDNDDLRREKITIHAYNNKKYYELTKSEKSKKWNRYQTKRKRLWLG